MRIRLTTLGAALLVVVTAAAAGASGFFSDDDGSVHEASIEAIADVGITQGCNPPVNSLYCPDRSVTRAQMATFLTRALDLAPATGSFMDTAGSVHEANIGALAAAGITVGCNPPVNDMFCPDRAVTRAQMATFLTRALNLDASPRIVIAQDGNLAGVELGTAEAQVVTELTSLLGPVTLDESDGCPYIVDPPNMRYVSWGSLTAVIRIIDEVGGPAGLVGWRYKLDFTGDPLPGGPLAQHIELPDGLELLDPIGDAATAAGANIQEPKYSWMFVDFGHFQVEATGAVIDSNAPIDGVQVGIGYDCL